MALTMSEWLAQVDQKLGKTDSKEFVKTRNDISRSRIESAEGRLDSIVAENNRLLSMLDSEVTAQENALRGLDIKVDPPDSDPSRLRDLEAPEDPNITDAIDSDVNIEVGTVDDWNIDSLGDMPDRPDLTVDIPSAVTNPHPFDGISIPNDDFSFDPEAYVSSQLDFIQGKISEGLSSDDELEPGFESGDLCVECDGNLDNIPIIDTSREQAIYDRAEERLKQSLQWQLDETVGSIQGRGFSLPPGVLTAVTARATMQYTQGLADLTKDIITSSAELEQKRTEYELQKAKQLTDAQVQRDTLSIELEKLDIERHRTIADVRKAYIEAGAQLEAILADIHSKNEAMKFEAAKEAFKAPLEKYSIAVDGAKAVMSGYVAEKEAFVKELEANTEYVKAVAAVYASEIDAYTSSIEAEKIKVEGKRTLAEIEATRVKALLDKVTAENNRLATIASVYESSMRGFASKVEALKTAETIDLTRYETEVKGRATEISSQVEVFTAKLGAIIDRMKLQVETVQSQASVAASIISASLNAMQTSASFRFDGSAGYRFGSSQDTNTNINIYRKDPNAAPSESS